MASEFIGRLGEYRGIDRTSRDSRLPANTIIASENFTYVDGRPKRRKGFNAFNQDRIRGSQLMKHASSVVTDESPSQIDKRLPYIYRTPLSYGLLRWHDDYQPKAATSWTVECIYTFGDKEELVTDPFDRRSENTYGSPAARQSLRNATGVYIYDQSVLSNSHTFRIANATSTISPDTTTDDDTFELTSLAISHDETSLNIHSTLISKGTYYPDLCRLTYPISNYVAGNSLHISIVYDATTRILRLYIDGSEIDKYTVPSGYEFAGESDNINGNNFTAAATTNSPIGTNLPELQYYSSIIPYANVFNGSGPARTRNWGFWGSDLATDANGWPTALAAGEQIQYQLLNNIGTHFPSGTYIATWTGSSANTISFGFDATETSRNGNRAVLNVTPAGNGILVQISAIDTADPIKDIEIYPEAYASTRPRLRTEFTNLVAPFACVRTMDSNRTNNHAGDEIEAITINGANTRIRTRHAHNMSTSDDVHLWGITGNTPAIDGFYTITSVSDNEFDIAVTTTTAGSGGLAAPRYISWDDATAYTHRSQALYKGQSVRDLCEIANAAQCDLWLCIPHNASDAYVTSMATEVLARLDTSLNCYIEWSNEVWNAIFMQYKYAELMGLDQGLHANANTARLYFQAKRSIEVFALWMTVWASHTGRVKRVLGGQHAVSANSSTMLTYSTTAANTDFLATACYFGGYLCDNSNYISTSTDTVANILSACTTDITGTQSTHTAAQQAVATANSVGYISYEAGEHLVGVTAVERTYGPLTAKLLEVVRDSGLTAVYNTAINTWATDTSGGLYMSYHLMGRYDINPNEHFGSWGALEYEDQDKTTAPKWQSLTVQSSPAGGLHRDIVLLNEHTVRGSYSSTCKVARNTSPSVKGSGHQTYAHFWGDATDVAEGPAPWACSPPSGAGLCELRYWNTARSAAEIAENIYSEIDPASENLTGYFKLDEGTGACFDAVNNGRYITVHHGYSSYVRDRDLSTGLGLTIADGQHVIRRYTPDAFNAEDSHIYMTRIFNGDASASAGSHDSSRDFTIQMEIRTPYTWQQELNKTDSSATITSTNGDTRDAMSIASYALVDGGHINAASASTRQTIWNDTAASAAAGYVWNRAFDSTLFSIEADSLRDEAQDTNNDFELHRTALTRALLTPSGEVAFEHTMWDNDGHARQYRIVSDTKLSLNTVHRITCRKRTLFYYNSSLNGIYAYGTELAIFLDSSTTADVTLTIGLSGTGIPSVDIVDSSMTNMTTRSYRVRDVIIGASHVRDQFDRSIRFAPLSASIDEARVAQRFMSPYEDQPGFFTLGFFRLWATALDSQDIVRYARQTSVNEHDALVYNLEIDNIYGTHIPNRAPFSDVFTLGFKGWGTPELDKYETTPTIRGAWSMQDQLGFGPKPARYESLDNEGTCTGLGIYTSTLAQRYGLLATFEGAVYRDEGLAGVLKHERAVQHGMLDEFSATGDWETVTIGDRTILSSPSGLPKIYDGEYLALAGIQLWHSGTPIVGRGTTIGSTLQADKWYGVRILYVTDTTAMVFASDQVAIKTGASTPQSLILEDIAPHPHPRVTAIYIAITQAVDSSDLALAANVFVVARLLNKYYSTYNITQEPATSATAVDLNYTGFPQTSLVASLNNRLYLAGDPNIPDIIYFSDAGNPERIDTLNNRIVIQESTGDAIVKMMNLFGSLFIFKPNSIWRLDEIATGQHQLTQVSQIGPVTKHAIVRIVVPETGRYAVVMWTSQGPYIFDGIKANYIGSPIEGPNGNYDWLDLSSVFIIHDVTTRELVFAHKSIINNKRSDRHDKAVVYNYRNNKWYEYTGIIGQRSLNISTSRTTADTIDTIKTEAANAGLTTTYKTLVGSDSGFIYQWAEGVNDGYSGVDSITEDPLEYPITSYDSDNQIIGINNANHPFITNALRKLWIAVFKRDRSQWFLIPVKSNTTNSITLDTKYKDPDFVIEPKDIVYVARPPANIEFAWDDLGIPFYDKQIEQLIAWINGEFLYRFDYDWLTSLDVWSYADNNSGLRRRLDIKNGNVEALKLWLLSFSADARIDGHGYEADLKSKPLKQ